jgi:hypothetical protein
VLGANVDLRRGIITDQHDGQARRDAAGAQPGGVGRDLLADPLSDRFAVDEPRAHAPLPDELDEPDPDDPDDPDPDPDEPDPDDPDEPDDPDPDDPDPDDPDPDDPDPAPLSLDALPSGLGDA